MHTYLLTARVAVLLTVAAISPAAAEWLNTQPGEETGEVTLQTVIWTAIAAAGTLAVALILYNKFRTKANSIDLDNPGSLAAAG